MKYNFLIPCVAGMLFLGSSMCLAGESQTSASADEKGNSDFYQKHIKNHLEIGTRVTAYSFKDSSQGEPFNGSYLGSLNEIYEHQNYAPVKFFGQYKFSPYGGIGIAYDQFKAVTGSSPHGEAWGDGAFELQGVYLYLLGSFENKSRFTPFAELGFAYYGVDFNAKENWTEGGMRVINPDNATGVALAIGCDVEIYKQWSLDFYLRYMEVDVDVDYVFQYTNHTPGTFGLGHYDYGVGVKYSF